jgi:hypothetical protein
VQDPRYRLIDASDLHVFFCPYRDSEVAPGATDYRGPRRRTVPGSGDAPVGADREENHPACCPIHVLRNDGAVAPVPREKPEFLRLRDTLLP